MKEIKRSVQTQRESFEARSNAPRGNKQAMGKNVRIHE
jgi:hypothetical protein